MYYIHTKDIFDTYAQKRTELSLGARMFCRHDDDDENTTAYRH